MGRSWQRVDLAEVQRRLEQLRRDEHLRAVGRIRAASLPRQRVVIGEGAGKHETSGVGPPEVSTTSNSGGSLGGCSVHGTG